MLCDLICTRSIKFVGIVPSLMNGPVENSSSNTTWNLGESWPVDAFITIATDTAWNSKQIRYIPASDIFYHLGSPAILTCNIASNT